MMTSNLKHQRTIVTIVHAAVIALSAVMLASCQGRPSDQPPIHVNPNMDHMPKYKAQSKSEFFPNGATMREPVSGTVSQEQLRADDVYFTGRDASGKLVAKMPMNVTMQLLQRGQERYNIYCAPCHGQTGKGNGIVAQRGFLPPPTFHSDLMRNYPDGHLFDVITNGIRNMPAYRYQVPVEDRWAIVSYLRALQRSQNATLTDIPEDKRKDLK